VGSSLSYPKRTLKFRPTKGYAADTPACELGDDVWGGSIRNAIFRKSFALRIGGARTCYSPWPHAVLALQNVRVDTTNYWLAFGPSAITARETVNSADVSPPGLTPVNDPWRYTTTLLNGVAVFTNGFQSPHYWAGSTAAPFVELPGWPMGSTCKSIAAFKYHLFAIDVDEAGGHFENKVMWSDAAPPGAVPGSWTPAPDTEAGSTELADTPGPALLAVPLRGSMLVYKRSAMYAADYLEGDTFVFRTLFTNSGALTRHAVCDVNGQHLVVTDGDIVRTDGTNRASIGQARMREFMFSQLDSANYENVFAVFHRAKGEAIIGFPETGSTRCTKALVYDMATDCFGVRDLPQVACAAVGVVNDTSTSEIIDDQNIIIDLDDRYLNEANFSLATESLLLGYGATSEQQDTPDHVTRESGIGRYDLTMGAPERVKFVRRVHVRAQNYGTVLVRVGSRMTPAAPIDWTAEQALTEPAQIVNTFAQGRYISVEIRASSPLVWQISGLDIEYEPRGYF
jgi:hypothetical protein